MPSAFWSELSFSNYQKPAKTIQFGLWLFFCFYSRSVARLSHGLSGRNFGNIISSSYKDVSSLNYA